GDAFDFGGEIVAGVNDYFVGTGGFRDAGLLFTAHGAVDGSAQHFGHLDDETAGASGSSVDEALIARLEGKSGVSQIVGGHALQHGGGGGGEVNGIGQRHQMGGGDAGVLGVRAEGHGVSHAVTWFELRN